MARAISFDSLTIGMTIRHVNGTCYKIVKVEEKIKSGKLRRRVYARWRNGHIGRFGKEVVRICPKHVLGFLRYVARQHPPKPRRDEDASTPDGSG